MLTLEECEEVCMGMGRLSERDAVVSAANVLMVALLKMNRLIVPAFLRWRRAVRWRQIQNARQDLEREREKERRALAREEIQMHRAKNGVGILERISRVVGTGTKEPYTTQEPLLPSNGTHEPHLPLRNSAGGIGSGTPAQSRPSRPAQRQERRARRQSRDDRAEGSASGEPAHADAGNEGEEGLDEIQAAAESFFSRGSSSRSASRSSSAQQGDSEGGNTIDVFERRVQQLQLERAQDVYMGVYTSVGTTFVTFASIVIYSTVIISLVLALFPFERGQAVIFSFSLVATALVSESEVLRKGKTEEEKKKEKESKMKDLKNFRYKSKAPKGGANNLEAMENADHEADDVEDFSDLD